MTQVDIDVAIIGGGISGLAVAGGLLAAGQTLQLFEARPRLGGRIHSVPVAGGIAEMGATWFWDNEPRVNALVKKFDIAVHDQWETGDALLLTDGQVTRYSRPWSTNSRRFSAGSSQLIEGLAKELPKETIWLDSPVIKLKNIDTHVEVHLKDQLMRARRVVIALPPSLAIANELVDGEDLEAGLYETATDIAVWMGAFVKALAIYDTPFWREATLSGSATSRSGPVHEIHDISGVDGPGILFGFGQTQPDSHLDKDAFISQLVTLFGSQANKPLKVIAQDWRQEPWTTPNNRPLSDRYDLFGSRSLQQPSWGGKLFWSSTETSSVFAGHIEGALAAAERTVEAITHLV